MEISEEVARQLNSSVWLIDKYLSQHAFAEHLMKLGYLSLAGKYNASAERERADLIASFKRLEVVVSEEDLVAFIEKRARDLHAKLDSSYQTRKGQSLAGEIVYSGADGIDEALIDGFEIVIAKNLDGLLPL